MNVRGRTISVLGAARSGVAAAKLLHDSGATVFVSDRAPREQMEAASKELEAAGIPAEFGGNTARILEADILVVSPGVPSEHPMVVGALGRGIEVVSELEIASWFHNGPMLAITGTNGKTTTTTLAGRLFADARVPAEVAGNIGTAFSRVVASIPVGGVAVLEVSSFQLDHVRTFRPTVSVILNITPDHLDRYGFSFERYVEAKCRVFANQREGDTLVYNRDDAVTAQLVAERVHPAVRLLSFGMKAHGGDGAWVDDNSVWLRVNGAQARLLRVDEVSIRGTHNLHNAMAAVLGGKALWLRDASMRATLKNFKGVEHRLEFVRERDGVVYINDSKATNVDSVWYALQSFSSPIVLLLGGRDKGNDYSRLTDLVRQHVKQIIAIGESAEKVVGAFTGIVPTTTVKGMDEAVGQAAARAAAGDVVLLSPACASFDWFDNYEHRGRVFKKLVMDLPQGGRQ